MALPSSIKHSEKTALPGNRKALLSALAQPENFEADLNFQQVESYTGARRRGPCPAPRDAVTWRGRCRGLGAWSGGGEQGDVQPNPKRYLPVTVVPAEAAEGRMARGELPPEARVPARKRELGKIAGIAPKGGRFAEVGCGKLSKED